MQVTLETRDIKFLGPAVTIYCECTDMGAGNITHFLWKNRKVLFFFFLNKDPVSKIQNKTNKKPIIIVLNKSFCNMAFYVVKCI